MEGAVRRTRKMLLLHLWFLFFQKLQVKSVFPERCERYEQYNFISPNHDDPNCDFWDRLWISAKANGLTIQELYAICEQIAPTNFSGQMVNLVQPTNAPPNSNDYVRQYIELRKAVQGIVGSGV